MIDRATTGGRMDESDVRAGDRVGPYVLVELLGAGGMGQVWRATDTEHDDRQVALKLLGTAVSGDEEFAARFRREARIAGSLHHPNLVPVYRYGEAAGRLYLAMPELPGVDLDDLVARDGPLPPVRAVGIVAQLADALDAAHDAGLVHRDVKPGNVRVSGARDTVHLLDFGIARPVADDDGLTGTGQALGTTAYMAPERLRGDPVDRRADVYSLAAVLHVCLTGRRPFDAEGPAQVWAHLTQPPPRPSDHDPTLAPFDAVVAAGMAKAPDDRPATAGEFAARAQVGAPSQATVPTATPGATTELGTSTGGRPLRSRRRGLLTAAAIALVVVAVLAVVLVPRLSGSSATPSIAIPTSVLPPTPVRPAPLAAGAVAKLPLGAGAFAVTAAPDGRFVLVGNEEGGSVTVVDATRGVVAATVPTGRSPSGIAVSPDGRTAWAADDDGLVEIDLGRLAVNRTLPLPGLPTDVVASPDGSRLFVTLQDANQVVVLDVAGLEPSARAPTAAPQGVALSPDGRTLAVAGTDDAVDLIDAATLGPITRVPLPFEPFLPAFSSDGRSVLVPESAGGERLAVVDVATRQVRTVVPLGGGGVRAAASPDGTVYLHVDGGSDGANGTLVALDPSSWQVVRRLPVAAENSATVAVSPDGSRVYVVDQGTSELDTVAVR